MTKYVRGKKQIQKEHKKVLKERNLRVEMKPFSGSDLKAMWPHKKLDTISALLRVNRPAGQDSILDSINISYGRAKQRRHRGNSLLIRRITSLITHHFRALCIPPPPPRPLVPGTNLLMNDLSFMTVRKKRGKKGSDVRVMTTPTRALSRKERRLSHSLLHSLTHSNNLHYYYLHPYRERSS